MKRLLFVVAATVLLVGLSGAQAQSAQTNDITIPEFRQVLVDLGSYLDSRKGTHLTPQLEAASDEALSMIYPAVANPRELQRVVAKLKQHLSVRSRAQASSNFSGAGPTPLDVTGPTCGAPTTIIESGGACTPAYPDPTDANWQAMAGALIGVNAFMAPETFDNVSSQGCTEDEETLLETLSAAFQGTVEAASNLCAALPPIASNVCFGINTAIATAGAVSFGLFSDCVEQDGLVNAAKIDAGFQNTATIYAALGSSSSATLVQDISNSTATLGGDISALDTHLTNVDNHVAVEFGALTVQLQADYTVLTNQLTALTGQLTQGTALLDAALKQVMKLQLEPDGLHQIVPAILTCTGTNCPNVLNKCPAAGCSWNNVGPLP